MTDDEFRQFASRVLAEHDSRHAAHEARMAAHEEAMARIDRNYEKLLQLQLDLARSHDEHEGKMELMRATLDDIKEMLRERRNEGTW